MTLVDELALLRREKELLLNQMDDRCRELDTALHWCIEYRERIATLEDGLDDCHTHAVLMALDHKRSLNLDGLAPSHVGAIVRLCRRAVPWLTSGSTDFEAAVSALPPDESRIGSFPRRKPGPRRSSEDTPSESGEDAPHA